MRALPFLSPILMLLAAGCAPEVVDVNAYLGDQPFPAPSRQVTVFVECHPGDQPLLLARRAAQAVEAALDRRGYVVVEKPDGGDYVLASPPVGLKSAHTCANPPAQPCARNLK